MKYIYSIVLFALCLASHAATTPWTSYPTTNGFATTDTLIMGNGSTNLTIQFGAVASTLPITNTVNASSNLVYGNAVTQINTTSNTLNTLVNTSSNLVYGNSVTQINTTSNLLNTLVNTSSNLVYGNGVTQINTTSNLLNTQINTSSNLTYGNSVTQINTTSNLLNTLINTSSNLNFANTITAINTSSNNIYNLTGTNLVMFTNGPPTAGQAVVIVGTNTYGAVMVKGTNVWNGGGSGTVTAGTNIVVDSSAGANTVSLKDPASLGQINVNTAWLTNTVTPTNSFAGTVVDLSKAENGITNATGNLTFTGVANITSGAMNSSIVTVVASGGTRTIDVADASMHKETNWNTSLPSGWMMEVMVRVYPGIRTNFYQIIIP